MNEEALVRAISSSVKELQQRMDLHFNLVDRFMGNKINDAAPETIIQFCSSRSREHVMKAAIREAIDTLEDTRKAFKSKTLEALRKKLTQVLIDLN